MTARFELYYRPVHPHYAKEGRNTFSERSDANKSRKSGRKEGATLSRDYDLGRKPLYNCGGSFLRLCLDMIPHRSGLGKTKGEMKRGEES